MRAAKKRFRRERDRRTINRTFEGSVKNNKAILQKATVCKKASHLQAKN